MAGNAKNSGIAEPKWSQLLVDKGEISVAKAHWKRLTSEMIERETLAATNAHALQRLVLAYVVYDRCSKVVAAGGIVNEPAADNPKAIARVDINYKVMTEAAKDAERLESQLGISPQRRSKVGKVTKKRERSAGADAFLGARD